mgnify:CR=1 FL=1
MNVSNSLRCTVENKGTVTAAIILVALLTASGAVIYTQNLKEPEVVLICGADEIKVDGECITDDVDIIPIDVECSSLEVEVEEGCRPLTPPTQLDFGVEEFKFHIGDSIHLIPSFSGDGPDHWAVNPALPNGLNINSDSGEISGVVLEIQDSVTYAIIASNNAGTTTYNLSIIVIDMPPGLLSYSPILHVFTVGVEISPLIPSLTGGGDVSDWEVSPPLPSGLSIDSIGWVEGMPQSVTPCGNHSINASNEAGFSIFNISICIHDQSPFGMFYPAAPHTFTVNTSIGPIVPWIEGGAVAEWEVEPPLPEGLSFNTSNGWISGFSTTLVPGSIHTIWANNTGGSISTSVEVSIIDEPVRNLSYGVPEVDLAWQRSSVDMSPSWDGGAPVEWSITPELPTGLQFEEGRLHGDADTLHEWTNHTIWANNTGGTISLILRLRIADMTPSNISWENETMFAVESNHSVFIRAFNEGPDIATWEVEPPLPIGLALQSNGSIEGLPSERTNWRTYRIWANNSGGSFESNLFIAVHDLDADWRDISAGVGTLDYGSSWPSLILPLGEWSFPVAIDWNDRPIVSASHSGKGRIVGYGHEGMVAQQSGGNETTLSSNAIKWACGGTNKVVGVQIDYDHFEDELSAEGYSVHSNAWPSDLSSFDCFIGDFWNSYSDAENLALETFISEGGGVVLGGHSWYWSYSNSDVAHQYSGNKIVETTGLFVSSSSGSVSLDLRGDPPSEFHRTHSALEAVEAYFVDGELMSSGDKSIAGGTMERVISQIPLDFDFVWGPVREMSNGTGWVQISSSNTFDLATGDPLDRLLLKVQDRLLYLLPPAELPYHPSTKDFPGDILVNATRVNRIIEINGTFSGLPSNFGYAGARADGRMGTGLYAAAGEVVNVTFPASVIGTGVNVLVGAHTDSLWGKDTLSRHPIIYRVFGVDNTTMHVGNAFGGAIFIRIPAGKTLDMFNVSIENAVLAPYWIQGETDITLWNSTIRHFPAPWAEIESNNFILSVPAADIRSLETPNATMDFWDQALSMEHNLSGYTPWPRVERAVFDVQISAGWMHSGYPFMTHTVSAAGVLNSSQMWSQGDWGMFHELGHNHQWMPSTLPGNTETTCNLYSVKLMTELVGVDLGAGHAAMNTQSRETRTESYFQAGSQISSWSVWTALETHIQIQEAFGWDPITEALSAYYTMSNPPSGDSEEFNRWVLELSITTGYNLAPYHEAWGFPLTQSTKDSLTHLPVWVDDPLRGWVFEYDAIFRNETSNNVSSNSADVEWDVYDNGTNTNLSVCWGLIDGGTSRAGWTTCVDAGSSSVGHQSHSLSGLLASTTYYFRVVGDNNNGDTWSDVASFTTS